MLMKNKKKSEFFQRKFHIRTVIEEKPTSFDCTVCERTFSKKELMKRHVDMVHDDDLFKCFQCEVPFVALAPLIGETLYFLTDTDGNVQKWTRVFSTRR